MKKNRLYSRLHPQLKMPLLFSQLHYFSEQLFCTYQLHKCDFSGSIKDTSLNISTNNISSNIKIDSDEFALKQMKNTCQVRAKHKLKNKLCVMVDSCGISGLTNLEELSFLTVLALPKASRMGFACSNCLSSSP